MDHDTRRRNSSGRRRSRSRGRSPRHRQRSNWSPSPPKRRRSRSSSRGRRKRNSQYDSEQRGLWDRQMRMIQSSMGPVDLSTTVTVRNVDRTLGQERIKAAMQKVCGFRPKMLHLHSGGYGIAQFEDPSEAAALLRNTGGSLHIEGTSCFLTLTQGRDVTLHGLEMPSPMIFVLGLDPISDEGSLRSAFYALVPEAHIVSVKVKKDPSEASPYGVVEFATLDQAVIVMQQARSTQFAIDRAPVQLQYARRPSSNRNEKNRNGSPAEDDYPDDIQAEYSAALSLAAIVDQVRTNQPQTTETTDIATILRYYYENWGLCTQEQRDYYTQWAPIVFQTALLGSPPQGMSSVASFPSMAVSSTTMPAMPTTTFTQAETVVPSTAAEPTPAEGSPPPTTVPTSSSQSSSNNVLMAPPTINQEALEARKRKALELAQAKAKAAAVINNGPAKLPKPAAVRSVNSKDKREVPSKVEMKAWSERQAAILKAAAQAVGMDDENIDPDAFAVAMAKARAERGPGRPGIICSYWKAGMTCKYGRNCWNLHLDPISGIQVDTAGSQSQSKDPSQSSPPPEPSHGFQAPAAVPKAGGFAVPAPLQKSTDGFAAPPPLARPPGPRPGFSEKPTALPPVARPMFREAFVATKGPQ